MYKRRVYKLSCKSFLSLFKKKDKRCKVSIKGKNNRLFLITDKEEKLLSDGQQIPGFRIFVRGDNNEIKIYSNPFMSNNEVNISGNSCRFVLNKTNYSVQWACFLFIGSDNSSVEIGKDISVGGCTVTIVENNSRVVIGNDCMLAYDVNIRNSDGHTITDKSGNILNRAEDVIIGNHVWLAHRATLLKGSVIPDGSVVGSCSLVTKQFKENGCIIAGVPAKILKKGILWDRHDIDDYEKKSGKYRTHETAEE